MVSYFWLLNNSILGNMMKIICHMMKIIRHLMKNHHESWWKVIMQHGEKSSRKHGEKSSRKHDEKSSWIMVKSHHATWWKIIMVHDDFSSTFPCLRRAIIKFYIKRKNSSIWSTECPMSQIKLGIEFRHSDFETSI